jgi:hypothetical protein
VRAIIKVVIRPIRPEERVVRSLPVIPRSNGDEGSGPRSPQVMVRTNHEAPSSPMHLMNGVGTVIAVTGAAVAKVVGVADEVITSIALVKEP